MKYQPPFKPYATPAAPGIHSDEPNAGYVNGDPAQGIEGSIPAAEAFEHHLRELVHLITHSGQTPSHTDLEQVRKAIRWMIDNEVQIASIGGGTAIYQGQTVGAVHQIRSLLAGDGVTLTLVETAPGSGLYGIEIAADGGGGGGGGSVTQWQRLPIHPEIETGNNQLGITDNGNGTLTVQASQNVLWRGWDRVSTDTYSSGARTVTTLANKVYHLRYVRSTGFALKDLSDSGYNPSALAESNAVFDTTYDDMLIARITTNGSNVATVTPLVNKAALYAQASTTGTPTNPNAHHGWEYTPTVTLNWARAPKLLAVNGQVTGNGAPLEGYAGWISARSATRYAMTATVKSDWWEAYSMPTGLVGWMNFDAAA